MYFVSENYKSEAVLVPVLMLDRDVTKKVPFQEGVAVLLGLSLTEDNHKQSECDANILMDRTPANENRGQGQQVNTADESTSEAEMCWNPESRISESEKGLRNGCLSPEDDQLPGCEVYGHYSTGLLDTGAESQCLFESGEEGLDTAVGCWQQLGQSAADMEPRHYTLCQTARGWSIDNIFEEAKKAHMEQSALYFQPIDAPQYEQTESDNDSEPDSDGSIDCKYLQVTDLDDSLPRQYVPQQHQWIESDVIARDEERITPEGYESELVADGECWRRLTVDKTTPTRPNMTALTWRSSLE